MLYIAEHGWALTLWVFSGHTAPSSRERAPSAVLTSEGPGSHDKPDQQPAEPAAVDAALHAENDPIWAEVSRHRHRQDAERIKMEFRTWRSSQRTKKNRPDGAAMLCLVVLCVLVGNDKVFSAFLRWARALTGSLNNHARTVCPSLVNSPFRTLPDSSCLDFRSCAFSDVCT